MMRMMRKYLFGVLLVKLIFVLVLLIQGHWQWLLNFELAFLSSMAIVFGSFHGYKRLVLKRLESGEGLENDLLDKIEDPHELYEEEHSGIDEKTVDLARIVKDEKARLKQNKQTLKKTLKSSRGLFSLWRFIPYAVLVLSFIGLNNNRILDITAFLIGLGFGIASAVFIGIKSINR